MQALYGHQGQHGAGHALPGVQRLPPVQGEASGQPQPQGTAGVPADGSEGPGVEAEPGGIGAPFGGQADGPAGYREGTLELALRQLGGQTPGASPHTNLGGANP